MGLLLEHMRYRRRGNRIVRERYIVDELGVKRRMQHVDETRSLDRLHVELDSHDLTLINQLLSAAYYHGHQTAIRNVKSLADSMGGGGDNG